MTAAEGARADTFTASWFMTAAAVLIGVGTVANQADVATLLVIMALGVAVLALLDPRLRLLPSFDQRSVVTILVVGTVLEGTALAARAPEGVAAYSIIVLALTVLAVVAVLVRGEGLRRSVMYVVIAAYFALMAWMVAVSGIPDIDVYVIQQEGVAALLQGTNPFAITFENTAAPGSPYYAPELIEGDRLNFGFIYPPVSLMLAIPGYVLAGDYRFGLVAALAIAALVIAHIRPGPIATGAAMLLIFSPMSQQILYWGWSDPFSILLLAVVVFIALRRPPMAPIALGLLIASKQYLAPLYVLAIALLRDVRLVVGARRLTIVPLAVALITVLPFLAWDAGAFVHSTVTMHLLQPFRADSLSVPAVLVRAGMSEVPSIIGFVLAALALMFVVWRAARTPAGFCVAATVVLVVFFLFSKQAFMHYYFLPLAALASGIASATVEPKTRY